MEHTKKSTLRCSLEYHLFWPLFLAWVAVVLTGCPAEQPVVSESQDGSMRALAMGYGQFVAQNRGRPPKNEAQFRKFFEANPLFLDGFGVESIDDVFVSPRDNEPYEIVYGKRAKIVAYEKVGVDGKRIVADDLGIVQEVDEAQFAELVPDAK